MQGNRHAGGPVALQGEGGVNSPSNRMKEGCWGSSSVALSLEGLVQAKQILSDPHVWLLCGCNQNTSWKQAVGRKVYFSSGFWRGWSPSWQEKRGGSVNGMGVQGFGSSHCGVLGSRDNQPSPTTSELLLLPRPHILKATQPSKQHTLETEGSEHQSVGAHFRLEL